MLKQGLILQIMNQTDLYQKEKNKVIGSVKEQSGGKIIKEFFGVRAKAHSYLTVDSSGDKRAKGTKKYATRRKLKATQLKNKIKYLDKNLIDAHCHEKYHKEFVKTIN